MSPSDYSPAVRVRQQHDIRPDLADNGQRSRPLQHHFSCHAMSFGTNRRKAIPNQIPSLKLMGGPPLIIPRGNLPAGMFKVFISTGPKGSIPPVNLPRVQGSQVPTDRKRAFHLPPQKQDIRIRLGTFVHRCVESHAESRQIFVPRILALMVKNFQSSLQVPIDPLRQRRLRVIRGRGHMLDPPPKAKLLQHNTLALSLTMDIGVP